MLPSPSERSYRLRIRPSLGTLSYCPRCAAAPEDAADAALAATGYRRTVPGAPRQWISLT